MHSASLERPVAGRVRAVLALVRWPNALIAAAGVLLGGWWAGGAPWSPGVLWAAAAGVALAAFTNADNDWHDREIDLVAHPRRPLPSGALSPETARLVALVAAVAALAASAAAGRALLGATVVVLVLMAAYSRGVKRHGLPGNLLVAVLASCPFLYGAWAVGRPLAALPLLAVGVPLHLAREVAKDLDDAEGDAGRRRTLPVVRGAPAARTAIAVAVACFLAALVPLLREHRALLVALLPALIVVTLAVHRAATGRRGSPLLFKAAMLFAMAALLAVGRR